MGQLCSRNDSEQYDPNKVVTKEEYDEGIEKFNQFVRHHSQKEFHKLQQDEQQNTKSVITNTDNQGRTEQDELQRIVDRNTQSNHNSYIGIEGGSISRVNKVIVNDELAIADWIQIIIKDMNSVGFDGSEYEIHHTDCSIKLVLLFTAMNYKKIDQFIELDKTVWMEYVMIDIQYHHFDKVGIARICNTIQNLYHLQYLILDFSNNKIAMNNECISRCVSNLPDLKIFTLNLEANNIGEEGCRIVSKSLSNLKFLNQLNLNLKWNKMNDAGLCYFSDMICEMRFISQFTIDISGNNITEVGACALFDSISDIGKLQQLSISIQNNHVNTTAAISLANCIQQQDNLVELTLWLNGNSITAQGAYPIMNSLLQLFNLLQLNLDLSFNNISTYDAKQIRDTILALNQIRNKDLRFF